MVIAFAALTYWSLANLKLDFRNRGHSLLSGRGMKDRENTFSPCLAPQSRGWSEAWRFCRKAGKQPPCGLPTTGDGIFSNPAMEQPVGAIIFNRNFAMIDGKDLMWNRFSSLKARPDVVKTLVDADCNWQLLLEDLRQSGTGVQVVVTGIQNSGKSTLCNLLIGDNDNSTFEIGDREITFDVKREKNNETGVTIVDTPGFGTHSARKIDFDRLWRQADVVIYVASVRGGAISDQEEMLAGLRNLGEKAGLKGRICVVNSKMGESEHAEEIRDANSALVTQILGADTRVFLLDSHYYQEALKEDDAELARYSGVLDLLGWLDDRMRLPNRSEEIFREGKKKWLDTLSSAAQMIETSIGDTRIRRKSLKESLMGVWKGYKSAISSAWENCRRYI